MFYRWFICCSAALFLISAHTHNASADSSGDDFDIGAGYDDGSILGLWYDSDGDGFVDLLDACPFEWGEDVAGCPLPPSPVDYSDWDWDGDGDGILNGDDFCPETYGDPSCNGCPCPPEPTYNEEPIDSGADGWLDYADA